MKTEIKVAIITGVVAIIVALITFMGNNKNDKPASSTVIQNAGSNIYNAEVHNDNSHKGSGK